MIQAVQQTMLIMSFVYLLVLTCLFFIKKRINNVDTNIYSRLLIINICTILMELSLFVLGALMFNQGKMYLQQVFLFLSKVYVCGVILWFVQVAKYTHFISDDVKNEKVDNKNSRSIVTIIGIAIALIIVLVLPVEFVLTDSGSGYTTGLATKVAFLFIVLSCIVMIVNAIRGFKKKLYKKYVPILLLLILMIVCTILQASNPQLLLFNPIMVIVMMIMYFTIENPDIKMLEIVEIAKDRADKANSAKSDFLSSMSHEIRTPLNAICGFSEMINQSTTLEEAKENAKDIIGASETLLEIVNGILDISKIESGKIELIETDYDPYKMLEETVKLAKGRLAEKPLDFQVNIAQDIPKVLYGDKFNIKKILINFLTNAIKYTDEGFVRFDVQCVRLNDYVRLIFSVADSGRGIKKEDINKLFTKFQRLDEEKNQTIEGTGLGLAITKQLIDMMKGSVVVDSVYGEGSKFTFVLDQKISNAELADTTSQMNVVVDMTGRKVLVVDDNKLNLKIADKLLRLYGLTVTLCNSGHDCIELIEMGNKFDVILLDDMMPGMSGTETLIKLREMPSFNIPVVALTANAINGMKEKYLEAGFDDYLSKPIDKNELYKTLVKFLNAEATYDSDSNTMVISPEDKKEEVVETKSEEDNNPTKEKINQDPDVPRIMRDIPKFVPDNKEIVVLPGDKEKEDSKDETNNELDESTSSASNEVKDNTILIVDDNNLNIKVESKLITALGYNVESANSGVEAINKVKNNKYELIFMDIMMPMMDGIKTLHELQKIQGFDTPVVALTADAVLGAEEKYLKEGFDLYVTKPANKEDFDKIIKKFIN